MAIRIGDKTYIDERKPAATRDFNSRLLDLRTAEVSRSMPPGEPEIRRFLLDQVSTDFDHVFGLFVMSTRSPIFKSGFAGDHRFHARAHARRHQGPAAGGVLRQHEPVLGLRRAGAGSAAPVRSRTAGGQHPRHHSGAGQVGLRLPVLRGWQGKTEAVAKVRGVPAARQHVLNLARRELGRGLLAPFVCVSFSGETADVEALPEYRSLLQEAAAKGVTVTLQEMAPTNSVNTGANALSVGFIAQPHEPSL